MKLLTSTSSIRRMAWNACRSCSPDSDSMCADSLARQRRRRVHLLAALVPGSRSPVTGVNHSTSTSGRSSRRASAIARSRRTCPRPIGELRYSRRRGRRQRERRVAAAGRSAPRVEEVAEDPGSPRTGCRTCRRCPAPGDSTSFPPVELGEALLPGPGGTARSSVPCTTSTGQRTREASSPRVSVEPRTVACSVGHRDVSGSMSIAQDDGVLDLLGGVRFRQAAHAEEELGETAARSRSHECRL